MLSKIITNFIYKIKSIKKKIHKNVCLKQHYTYNYMQYSIIIIQTKHAPFNNNYYNAN